MRILCGRDFESHPLRHTKLARPGALPVDPGDGIHILSNSLDVAGFFGLAVLCLVTLMPALSLPSASHLIPE